jgi:hypothetical protein
VAFKHPHTQTNKQTNQSTNKQTNQNKTKQKTTQHNTTNKHMRTCTGHQVQMLERDNAKLSKHGVLSMAAFASGG